jgi:mono/diheme cytochrome c family protein
MSRLLFFSCGLIVLGSVAVAGQSSSSTATPTRPSYDIDYIGPPLADPVMQHAKETYVVFGCAYCHGVTLTPRGEATDLTRSALVGSDTNGDRIAALLRAGIPQTAKLSPMPQFSDLSDRQLHDIARYIHYARQEARYKQLVDVNLGAGDTAAGKAYFDQQCVSCHADGLAGIARKYDAATLRDRLLKPRALSDVPSFEVAVLNDAKMAAARERHNHLLENYAPTHVANLVAYLSTR